MGGNGVSNKNEIQYSSILFVCDANTWRSPMAEFIFKHLLSELDGAASKIKVRSGGIGSHARDDSIFSLDAKLTLKDYGITPSEDFLSRDLNTHTDMVEDADLIITMTEVQKERLQMLKEVEGKNVSLLKEFVGDEGEILDPRGQGDLEYDACYKEIKDCLDKMVDMIIS